jgi:peptide/nickel transport system substrate-binding protein
MTRILKLLAIVLALLWSGAFAQGDPKVLNFGVYFEPSGLDPNVTTDAVATWMANNLYDTLVRYETTTLEDGSVVGTLAYKPWLAESWTVSEDGLEYVFQIRDGVPFHNGDILTAEDVAFSLQRVLILNFAPAQLLRDCTSPELIASTGPLEVTVELVRPCPFVLDLLARTQTGIIHNRAYVMANGGVEPETINEHVRNNPMGTGPFRWGEWEPGVLYQLIAFPDAWSGAPMLDRIDFRFISDMASQYVLMQQGALDIEEIAEAATLGLASPARGAFPSIYPGFTDAHWVYDRDVEKAKQLLAEAGFPNGFDTTISYNSGNAQREISAVVAQAQLAEVGIRAEVQALAWPTFVDGFRAGTLPMFVVSGTAAPVPDQFIKEYFGSGSHGPAGNLAFYSDDQVDDLIDELARTFEPDARLAIMDRIQARLMDTLPSVYLFNAVLPYVVRAEVNGWIMYPSSDWFFNTVYKD